MSLAVTLVHKAFAAFGLRVVRAKPANRFDAMCDSLRTIARAGFVPTIVIDAGANMGQWARKASAVFPDAPSMALHRSSKGSAW